MVSVELLGFENVKNFIKLIKENAERQELYDEIGRYMKNSTVRKLKDQKFKGNPPPTSDFTKSLRRGENKSNGKTLLDNGKLLNSIEYKTEADKSVRIGSQLKYAKIHNEGGIISAKKDFLYIPGTEEIKVKSQVVGVKDTISFFKSDGYRVYRQGRTLRYYKPPLPKGEEVPVMFYLTKSVNIPKREYLYKSDDDEKVIQGIIKRHLFKGVK